MEILIVVSERGGRSSVFLGWERRDCGFDVTTEAKKFSGKEGVEGEEEMWQQKFVILRHRGRIT